MESPELRDALFEASSHVRHRVERIEAELLFAEQLCELHRSEAGAWRPRIAKAREQVRSALAARRLDTVACAVCEAENTLGPLGKVAKSYTVHCVGHAHIDMNWMWSWPETVAVTLDTFSTVLRLMDQYPEFRFSQSQASTYAIVEQYQPEMLERIAGRVKEGRWEVTASHWVEGDKNLAGGESLCRHLLYARRYMQKLFGLAPEDVPIDWSPDTFGHAATLPSYLVRGGVKYLYLHRPGVQTPSKPEAFWWQGPDGCRVLVRNDMRLGYNGQITPAVAQHLARFVQHTGGRDAMFVFGVGDHGGGPTRRDILCAIDMDTWPVFPNVRFSTARSFYELLEGQSANLPVVAGELNMEFTGCYTTQSLIKKANRFAESRLVDAEQACALAWLVAGRAYPGHAFLEGWRDTLFSQFHDILPGSGVRDTRTYTHGLYQKTMAATSAAEAQALRELAALVDTSDAEGPVQRDVSPPDVADSTGGGVGFGSADGDLTRSDQTSGHGPRPFILFNPTAFDREEVVEATIWRSASSHSESLQSRSFSVRLPDGGTVPTQATGGGTYWGHDYATLAFPAKVDACGYARYVIVEDGEANALTRGVSRDPSYDGKPSPETAWLTGVRHHCSYAPVERSVEGLENGFLRVELDTATGGIRSLLDKRTSVELIAPEGPAPALEYAVERPHGMTAWSIDHTGSVEQPRVRAIRRDQPGPHKASMAVDLRVHESDLSLTYELRARDPKLYVHVKATWFQRGTSEAGVPVLSFALPLAVKNARARYEIPFGAIERDLNRREEAPALQWAQVTGKAGRRTAGCLLLNDCKHGHSLEGNTLRLTLIRSSYEPDPLPEIGEHEVHLAVLPFAGEMSVPEAMREGQAFNHAIRLVSTDIHTGPLPCRGQFLKVEPDSVILSAVKKAEDGDALVVRLVNPTDESVTANLELNADLVGKAVAVREVDLLERPVASSSASASQNTVNVAVPARGITSLQVELAGRRS